MWSRGVFLARIICSILARNGRNHALAGPFTFFLLAVFATTDRCRQFRIISCISAMSITRSGVRRTHAIIDAILHHLATHPVFGDPLDEIRAHNFTPAERVAVAAGILRTYVNALDKPSVSEPRGGVQQMQQVVNRGKNLLGKHGDNRDTRAAQKSM